jgi:PIN domain nuclease of toxin-antitoxin system
VILLDTHVLLWLAEDDKRLGRQARETIDTAAAAGNVIVSAISFWEIGMLIEKGRIALSMPPGDFAEILGRRRDIEVAPVDARIAIEAANPPPGLHGDPCDRLIIATARARALPLLTADRLILACGKEGHVQVLDARL